MAYVVYSKINIKKSNIIYTNSAVPVPTVHKKAVFFRVFAISCCDKCLENHRPGDQGEQLETYKHNLEIWLTAAFFRILEKDRHIYGIPRHSLQAGIIICC